MTAEVDTLVSSTLAKLISILESQELKEEASVRNSIFDAYSASFTSIDVKYHSLLFRKLSLLVHPDKLKNPPDDENDIRFILNKWLTQRGLLLDILQKELAKFQPGKSNIIEELVNNPNTGMKKLYERAKAVLSPMLFAYKRYYSPFNILTNLISWVVNIGLIMSGIALIIPFSITNFVTETLNMMVRSIINSISNNAVKVAVELHIDAQYSQGEANHWNNVRFMLIEAGKILKRRERSLAQKCTPQSSDNEVLNIYNNIYKNSSRSYDSNMRSHLESLAKQTDDEIDNPIKDQFNQLSNSQIKDQVINDSYLQRQSLLGESVEIEKVRNEVEQQIRNNVRSSLKPTGLTIIAITFKALGSVILNSDLSVVRPHPRSGWLDGC